MELKSVNNDIKTALQVAGTYETQLEAEEQLQVNPEAKERDENGPWVLWSELKPPAAKCFCSCESIGSLETALLTDILTRYGNNPDNLPPLLYAILQNDVVAVDLLLKHGASPFTQANGNNCLYYAIRAGSLPLVKKFIDLGVSVEHVHDNAEDALWVAQHFNQTEIVKYLEGLNRTKDVEQLAIIQAKYGNNRLGIPTLHFAIVQGDEEAFDLLLKYGADPFAIDVLKVVINQYHNTLYYAVQSDSLHFIKLLLDLGGDIKKFVNKGGVGRIQGLIEIGSAEVIKFILTNMDFLQRELQDATVSVIYQKRFTTLQKKQIIHVLADKGVNFSRISDLGLRLQSTHDTELIEFMKSLGAILR